ncbi:MAG: acyltransferase family protein [Planctomycetaceae bacterium]|nr:acyltransferase family protein [Planctomycetaceae bacterium]
MTSSTRPAEKEYWHGMAALRGFAMLLGVVHHAAIPFMDKPLRGLQWVYTQTPTLLCDVAFWWGHAWRIPLFFFLAGFFSQLTLQRYGVQGFATRRFRRLVIPYVVAAFTIGPLIYLVFHGGWYLTGQCSWEQMWPTVALPANLGACRFGPAHLWFLLELIIISITYAVLFVVFSPEQPEFSEVRTLPGRWWIPLAPGILSGLMLWGAPGPMLDFHNTFFHVPDRMLYHMIYFVGGAIAYRHRRTFLATTSYYRRHMAIAAALSAVYLWLRLGQTVDISSPVGSCLFSLCAGVLCWLMIYALIGAFNQWFRHPNAIVSYLSDASYWVYLVHLPVVVLFQLALYNVAWPSAVKFLAAISATTCVCLISYQGLVRYTRIGEHLHGPRTRQSGPARPSAVSEQIPTA